MPIVFSLIHFFSINTASKYLIVFFLLGDIMTNHRHYVAVFIPGFRLCPILVGHVLRVHSYNER